MSQRTTIEWATHTWNPVTGCTKVSQGCKHCYAERLAKRFSRRGILPGTDSEGNAVEWDTCESPNGPDFQVLLHPERLDEPLHWRKPRRVFVCSMSDLFHEAVPDDFRDRVFASMALAAQHTFMVLTKRPRLLTDYMAGKLLCGRIAQHIAGIDGRPVRWAWGGDGTANCVGTRPWPLPNVWLGVSVEDQATADERIPLLLQTPAAVRFVSYEPALGPVNFKLYLPLTEHGRGGPIRGKGGLDWIICGGESGPGARPMHPDLARSARDQCQAAGVPFFLKQRGEWLTADEALRPGESSIGRRVQGEFVRVGKKRAGRLLDGREHNDYPREPIVTKVTFGTIDETGGVSAELSRLRAEVQALEASVERLHAWVDDLHSGMYVNCVYCGHRYGPGETTPVSMADALKAHVEQCPEHPMSALRAALAAAEAREEEAAALMQEFVDRCERGEVRSRYTYGRFVHYLRSRPAEGAPCEEKGASDGQ